jgi:hypothetical protein
MAEQRRRITAVFACELREDLGFAAPLLSIGDELVRLAELSGCSLRAVFVVADPIHCGHEIASRGHDVLPAPSIKRALDIRSEARSYSNVLATIGFGDQRELKLSIDAWDRIFAHLSPDLLVVDSSPVACLAARGRIPVLVTGSGFAEPPIHMAAFPAIIGDAQPETNQALIRDVVNTVLRMRGVPTIENPPEFLAGDRRAIFAVPQLDPYRATRSETLFNAYTDIQGPLVPSDVPSIFLSLPATFAHLTTVVRGVERAGATISAYIHGARSVGLTLLRQIRARIFETRPILSEALRDVSAVVAASADVAVGAFLAGRPQLILRSDVETSLLAAELVKRRVAIAPDVKDARTLADAIRTLLDDQSYMLSAQEEARRTHASMPPDCSAARAARWCMELIGRSGQGAIAAESTHPSVAGRP